MTERRKELALKEENNQNLRQLSKIAHMYYFENLTQMEIANKIHVSRSLVSKLLTRAKEIGLVEIIIHDEKIKLYSKLESELEKKFDIKEVICVQDHKNCLDLKVSLGTSAALYLKRVVQPGQTIGVFAGSTIYEMSNNFNFDVDFRQNTFIPMAGGLGTNFNKIHAHNICEILSKKTNARKLELYAPLVLDSIESKDIFLKQKYIKEVINEGEKVSYAVVGVGGNPINNSVMEDYFSKNKKEVEYLEKQHAVGDIGYMIIDTKGKKIDTNWNDCVLSVKFEDLTNTELIVVAGGEEKYEAIKAVMKGEFVDVLITDRLTGEKLLNQYY